MAERWLRIPDSYRVDGEAGRFGFSCHFVRREGAVILDTLRELFPPLIGKERYQTAGFKELAVVLLNLAHAQTALRYNVWIQPVWQPFVRLPPTSKP